MSHQLLRAACFAALAATALAFAHRADAASGPVAAYSFDQAGPTVADVSGSQNTATVSGAAWVPTGRYGGAYSFDGSSSTISVPDSSSLDLTRGMTLEAWVAPATAGQWQSVLLKEQPSMLAYALYATDASGSRGEISLSNGGHAAVDGLKPPAGAWTHLAATYDGNRLRLYVNGQLASSKRAPGSLAVSTGALRIGGNSIWGEWFDGRIDEVRVYNRALGAAGIQSDMRTPLPTPPAADTTPPAAPSGLTVSAVSQTAASLAWAASTDDTGVTGYDVYVSGSKVGSTTSSSFSVSGLSCGTAYELAVDAYDAAGNRSARAAASTVTQACTAGGGGSELAVSPAGSDASDCSLAAPCLTWNRAYRQASPGATVDVLGGTYPAQTIAVDSTKAGATQDVTFVRAAGATVALRGDLTIYGSHVHVVGPMSTDVHHKLLIDSISTPQRTHDVRIDDVSAEDFVVGPASYVTIHGGSFGPSVGCQDTGEYENKISASSALPGVSPDHVMIDGVTIHDQTTVNSVSCHNGGLNIVGGTYLTIQNSRWFRDMVYDIEFDDFTGGFPLHDVLIQNNWFGAPTGAIDNAGGCSSGVDCKGEADVQVKWNGVAATNWLVRFNSFQNGFAPEWGGAPPGYSSFRILGNAGGNAWSGRQWLACAPAGKPGVTIQYNAWAGMDNLGSAPSSARCGTTDVDLGPVTDYGTSSLPYLDPSISSPDFHLMAGSRADGVVTPATSDFGLATDIDGDPRLAPRDAGADEHSSGMVRG